MRIRASIAEINYLIQVMTPQNMFPDKKKYIDDFRKSLDQYTPVKEESFEEMLSLVKFGEIQKGEHLLQVNQIAKKIYFVCKGIFTSLFITPDGGTHIKNFFLEGNFAGSKVSLLSSTPSAFGIQCLEEGVVIEMDYQRFKQLIYNHNDLKDFYIGYLEHKWVMENERRQIAFATQTATERYLTFLQEYPLLEDRVPQLHIASYLGITPTQLSRIRKEF